MNIVWQEMEHSARGSGQFVNWHMDVCYNNTMNSYYVYAYLRKDRFSPYYVGKGKEGSFRHLSPFHSVTVPADRTRVVIIKDNMTDLESQALERALIRFWGRQDINTGVLRNRTNGGEGSEGRITTAETRDKMRQLKLGKALWGGSRDITWGDRISEARMGKGRGNTNARRYPNIVKGVRYESKKEAAEAHGCQWRTLVRRGWVEWVET